MSYLNEINGRDKVDTIEVKWVGDKDSDERVVRNIKKELYKFVDKYIVIKDEVVEEEIMIVAEMG